MKKILQDKFAVVAKCSNEQSLKVQYMYCRVKKTVKVMRWEKRKGNKNEECE